MGVAPSGLLTDDEARAGELFRPCVGPSLPGEIVDVKIAVIGAPANVLGAHSSLDMRRILAVGASVSWM